jgi:hypothetical protein
MASRLPQRMPISIDVRGDADALAEIWSRVGPAPRSGLQRTLGDRS